MEGFVLVYVIGDVVVHRGGQLMVVGVTCILAAGVCSHLTNHERLCGSRVDCCYNS